MLNIQRLTLLLLAVACLSSVQAFAQQPQPTATPPGGIDPGPTLSSIQRRGLLECGVDQEIFGFGFLNPNTGNVTGINVDFCRAIATAIFGDASAVDLRLQSADATPDALLSGSVDVLIAQKTVQTLSQDGQSDLDFGPTTFYDGQSIMVRVESGIETWEDLDEQTICAITGEGANNIVAAMNQRDLSYDLQTFDNVITMQEAFMSGRCNAQTLQRSLLEIRRQSSDDPSSYRVWSEPFTRIAVGPVYRYGDPQWSEIVNWTIWGLIHAEELGITSKNIDQFLRTTGETDEVYINRVGIRMARLLDPMTGIGSQLGLPNDFMVAVIRQVGNYGEIYDRSLGPTSALPIERSLNSLWTAGGFMYAPPWE